MTEAQVTDAPRWVDAILDWPWTLLAARVGLTAIFIFGGIAKAIDFQGSVAELEGLGYRPGALWAAMVILVELAAPALLIWGRFVWLAAGALGVLTLVANVEVNDFWTMHGAARFAATIAFLDDFGLIAGLIMAAFIAEHERRRGKLQAR